MKNIKASQLCRLIEELQESFQIHRFDFTNYSERDNCSINSVRKFFNLKTYDLMILCLFIVRRLSSHSSLTLNHIVKHFQLKLADCIQLDESLQYLKKKHLIVTSDRSFRNEEKEYTLSQSCLKAILTYNRSLLIRRKNESFESFLKELDALVICSREYSDDDFAEMFSDLVSEYNSIQEIKWLKAQKFSKRDELIICLAIRSHVIYGESMDMENSLKLVSGDSFSKYQLEKELLSGNNRLISEDYLSFNSAQFISLEMKLTNKTISGMCSLIEGVKKTFHPKMCSLIFPEAIQDVHYQHSNEDLKLIEDMVSRVNYEKIKEKVPRLVILLTGDPGVGKTSFVHHLAKKCERPILTANIATILSKYVGESEKNIFQLFDEIDQAYLQFEVTPIVIFDEGETLLFSRNAKSASAVDQMNNNMISLLLQCLDKFRGILIFTSNFDFTRGSFDTALHRRFHSIIKMQSPSKDMLGSIFRFHFPHISSLYAATLIDQYPFITPAQIKNLKEKFEVQQLFEVTKSQEELLSHLAKNDLESYSRSQKYPVGF